ncbi:MAG: hypothetical protein IPO27_04160 [Bacteroidetes bacterium]|nr:hypothetical protein [Bacteroidota bacterium]
MSILIFYSAARIESVTCNRCGNEMVRIRKSRIGKFINIITLNILKIKKFYCPYCHHESTKTAFNRL